MSNDFSNPPVPPPPPPPLPTPPMMTGPAGPRPFFNTWMDALTKPNEQTYRNIATASNASSTQAFIWVFIGALVQSFISFLVSNFAGSNMLRDLLRATGNQEQLPNVGGGGIVGVICGAPIAAVLAVIFFALFVGVAYLISRAFNGHATFDQLAYVLAAITVPVTLISSVLSLLSAIPFVGLCFGLLSFLLALYALALEVIAVKAVAGVDWLGAIVSVLAVPVLVCLCLICVFVFGFAALAPALGNVFSGMGPFPVPTP